jgi:hypothetical protein
MNLLLLGFAFGLIIGSTIVYILTDESHSDQP